MYSRRDTSVAHFLSFSPQTFYENAVPCYNKTFSEKVGGCNGSEGHNGIDVAFAC